MSSKYKHTITITLETDKKISSKAEGDLVAALTAQLEGLSDDNGIKYANDEVNTSLNTIQLK